MTDPGRTPPMRPLNLEERFNEVADDPPQHQAEASTSRQQPVSEEGMMAAFSSFGEHLVNQISFQISSLAQVIVNSVTAASSQRAVRPETPLNPVTQGQVDGYPHPNLHQPFIPPQGQQYQGYISQPSNPSPHLIYPPQHVYPPQMNPPRPPVYPPQMAYHPQSQEYPHHPGHLQPPAGQHRLTGNVRSHPDTGFEDEGRAFLMRFGQNAFTDDIIFEPTPPFFRTPKLREYDGQTDPADHICRFQDSLTVYTITDQMRCRLFLMTLAGEARQWFCALPHRSIYCFPQFISEFLAHFSSSRKPLRTSDILLAIRQGQNESLREYVTRFRALQLTVTELEPAVARSALKMGLKDGLFKHSLSTAPVYTMDEMLKRAWLYINAEEERSACSSVVNALAPGSDTLALPAPALPTSSQPRRSNIADNRTQGRQDSQRRGNQRTVNSIDDIDLGLSMPICAVAAAIKNKEFFEKPAPMKSSGNHRDKRKFCNYHEDHGHDTNDCRSLKLFLSRLIKEGLLKEFLKKAREEKGKEAVPEAANLIEYPPLMISSEMYVIAGGCGSLASHKNSIRDITREVLTVDSPSATKTQPIQYDDRDLPLVANPYHDAVVIQVVIHSVNIHRVLVDSGSSANILFYEVLAKLNLDDKSIRQFQGDLVGFTGDRKVTEGIITLPLAVRCTNAPTLYALRSSDFIVVKGRSPYNIILGRPFMNDFKVILSTRHFSIKFPANDGRIITTKGDPWASRKAYLNMIKFDSPNLLHQAPEATKASQSQGGVSEILIPNQPEQRTLKISDDIKGNNQTKLINFLLSNIDVFAWLPSELSGVDINVACHRLNVSPSVRPIKQRKRKSADQKQKEIRVEVQKLLDANFIKEIQYPEWVSNVVMVEKASGEWRMCVDFTCLNKHCPKDSYPLPAIDSLVDSVNGYEMMSFLDAYSGFHQIKMHPGDQAKTAFITNDGTFCYTVMPFGLKNAGATYQRLMDNIFREQRGRNLEVYVDDILVKSLEVENHIADLQETFDNLRQFNVKLNPLKCVFGATYGKFLGYMVGPDGIKPNPDKIEAIMKMQPPTDISKLRTLIGRVSALSRFISRSGEKCAPLFASLKKSDTFLWNEDCQKSFELLKKYLSSAPTMSSPLHGEDLCIYLGAGERAVSSVLLRNDGAAQCPVYYVSKTLNGAEANYSMMEKLVFALIISVRRLRQYFQVHKVLVVTDRPMRQIIQRPDVSGRLIKWSVELGEFDIEFVPRTAIKAQALADFIADFPPDLEEQGDQKQDLEESWELFTDGAAGNSFCGAGIVLKSPEGLILYGAIRLFFNATNNQAEYEAILAGLRLAVGIGLKRLIVKTDSLLAVRQILNEYDCRELSLMKYLDLIRLEIKKFHLFKIQHVPRDQNQVADALSRNEGPNAVMIKELHHPSTQDLTMEVQVVSSPAPASWMSPIMSYLEDGSLPSEKIEARALRLKAARYFLWEGFLYKKSYLGISLKCVHPLQVLEVLEEVHSGECGSHSAGHTLTQRLLRQGYYWPSMKKDAQTFAKSCLACQLYGKVLRQPSQPLQPIISPWPFAMWGMDFVGPFPMGSGQRKFMLLLIDYFTKWVEAVAIPKATTEAVIKFLSRDVFSRFGLPLAIITDNGSQFTNVKLKTFCESKGVSLKFASVAHPQTNGQAEAANKAILTILKKRLMGLRTKWADELPSVLWAYRSAPSTITGESPFTLAFGMEAMSPAELMVPTARAKNAMLMEEENLAGWADQNNQLIQNELEVLEERRAGALLRIRSQKQKAIRHINAKVRPRNFQPGDLVLRKLEITGKSEGIGKLAASWEGPYIIKKIAGQGAYQLQTSEGCILPRTWNGDDLKLYKA